VARAGCETPRSVPGSRTRVRRASRAAGHGSAALVDYGHIHSVLGDLARPHQNLVHQSHALPSSPRLRLRLRGLQGGATQPHALERSRWSGRHREKHHFAVTPRTKGPSFAHTRVGGKGSGSFDYLHKKNKADRDEFRHAPASPAAPRALRAGPLRAARAGAPGASRAANPLTPEHRRITKS